jgi:hypothetical protein
MYILTQNILNFHNIFILHIQSIIVNISHNTLYPIHNSICIIDPHIGIIDPHTLSLTIITFINIVIYFTLLFFMLGLGICGLDSTMDGVLFGIF